MTSHPKTFLGIIIAIAVVAGIFAYPGSPLAQYRPWRLGLDLVGGSQLTYEVDLSSISQTDQTSVLSGLRDVIERRVNAFGVSEPLVYVAKSGDKSSIVAELAGERDIEKAIQLIGETPLLDFREVEGEGASTTLKQTALTGRVVWCSLPSSSSIT